MGIQNLECVNFASGIEKDRKLFTLRFNEVYLIIIIILCTLYLTENHNPRIGDVQKLTLWEENLGQGDESRKTVRDEYKGRCSWDPEGMSDNGVASIIHRDHVNNFYRVHSFNLHHKYLSNNTYYIFIAGNIIIQVFRRHRHVLAHKLSPLHVYVNNRHVAIIARARHARLAGGGKYFRYIITRLVPRSLSIQVDLNIILLFLYYCRCIYVICVILPWFECRRRVIIYLFDPAIVTGHVICGVCACE